MDGYIYIYISMDTIIGIITLLHILKILQYNRWQKLVQSLLHMKKYLPKNVTELSVNDKNYMAEFKGIICWKFKM